MGVEIKQEWRLCVAPRCRHRVPPGMLYCPVHMDVIPPLLDAQVAMWREVGGDQDELAAIGREMLAQVKQFVRGAKERRN